MGRFQESPGRGDDVGPVFLVSSAWVLEGGNAQGLQVVEGAHRLGSPD